MSISMSVSVSVSTSMSMSKKGTREDKRSEGDGNLMIIPKSEICLKEKIVNTHTDMYLFEYMCLNVCMYV